MVAENRQARGMSQQELAILCGTTQSAIARLERGGRPPKLDTLMRIADALDAELLLEMRLRDPQPRGRASDGGDVARLHDQRGRVDDSGRDAHWVQAARKMRTRNVGAAVVVEDERIVGIFTERDLLRAIADSRHPDHGQVQSYMTPDPITLPPDHSPSEAAQIMNDRKFRHIPVVEDDGWWASSAIRDLIGAGLQLPSEDAHVGSDFP